MFHMHARHGNIIICAFLELGKGFNPHSKLPANCPISRLGSCCRRLWMVVTQVLGGESTQGSNRERVIIMSNIMLFSGYPGKYV